MHTSGVFFRAIRPTVMFSNTPNIHFWCVKVKFSYHKCIRNFCYKKVQVKSVPAACPQMNFFSKNAKSPNASLVQYQSLPLESGAKNIVVGRPRWCNRTLFLNTSRNFEWRVSILSYLSVSQVPAPAMFFF